MGLIDYVSDMLAAFGFGVFLAVVASVLCILIHYEGLNLLEKLAILESRWLEKPRPRIVLVMVGVLLLHVTEILLMSLIYALLTRMGFGYVEQVVDHHRGFAVQEYVYFSSVMYTSLGLGDMLPHGLLKILAPVEALMGMILIAWSASFTYLLMQRLWGKRAL